MLSKSLFHRSALLALFGVMTALPALAERPILTSEDKSIAAFLDGPGCADTVKTIFRAKKADAFASGNLTAGRLMNNITALVSKSCPSVTLVRTTGIVDNRKVYSGVADAETGWEIVEYGLRNSGGFIASSHNVGDTPDLPDYLAASSYTTFGDVVQLASTSPFLCTNHDAASGTCTLITTFENATASGATMVTRQLIDDDGAVGTVTLSGETEDGLWCGNPQEATVVAAGGKLAEGSKSQAAMEEMLLERVQDAGEKVCVGYAMSNGKLTTTQFDGGGFQLFSAMQITPQTSESALRRD